MKKILILLSLAGVLTACNGFLDMTPTDSISDKVMWADVQSAEYAVNSIYSYAYDIYAVWPSSVGMTEAFEAAKNSTGMIPELANAMGTALTTTGAGLTGAVICCMGHNYLAARLDSILLDMEKASMEIVSFFDRRPLAEQEK